MCACACVRIGELLVFQCSCVTLKDINMLKEHGMEHGNTEDFDAVLVANPVDSVTDDAVTVTARAPGVWHPECGAHSDIQPEFKPATKRGGARAGAGRPPASVRIAPGADGPRWYCVEVHARCEVMVAETLLALGFAAVAPMFMDRLAANPIRRLPAREVLRPAYPGYVVVEFDAADPAWRRIASQRGVRRVMGSAPERPTPLLAVQAAWIIAQFGCDGVQRRSLLGSRVVAEPLVPGAWVRVSSGPFDGALGHVVSSNGVGVVLTMAGRTVRMAQAAVEVAGPPQP